MHSGHDPVFDFVKAVTEKLHPVRDVTYGGLLGIDFEFHASFEKSRDACQRSLCGSF